MSTSSTGLILRSASSRVSKDGGTAWTSGHPSRRALKKRAPQDEVRESVFYRSYPIGFMESIY